MNNRRAKLFNYIREYSKILLIVLGIMLYCAVIVNLTGLYWAKPNQVIQQFSLPVDSQVIGGMEGVSQADNGYYFQLNGEVPAIMRIPLSLQNVEQINVSFHAESDAGVHLFVDLCGEDYDNPEQEIMRKLDGGENDFTGELYPGATHPDQVDFRIFSFASSNEAVDEHLSISNIYIESLGKGSLFSRIHVPSLIAALLFAAAIVVVLVVKQKSLGISNGFQTTEDDVSEVEAAPIDKEKAVKKTGVAPPKASDSFFMNSVVVTIVGIILFTPLLLGAASHVTDTPCDVALLGYTDSVSKPYPSLTSFWNGTFQSSASVWIEQNLKPRGVLTKMYSTIRYNLFNLGNRPIGLNGDIFEWDYINSLLCLGGFKDYSVAENASEMADYVDKLVQLQNKLARFGKFLFLYIAPNKAYYDYENIPGEIKALASDSRVDAVECFSELIATTDIPHIIFRDSSNTLPYPAFYSTGIHWSRPFEQQASVSIIEYLKQITKKSYRNLILCHLFQSSAPYWRDNDVFELLNVWNKPDITYYEYSMEADASEHYDRLGFLIQGDSFMTGICRDVKTLYPNESVYQINRNQTKTDRDGIESPISSFDDVPLARWLDNVDVVIIESTEPGLTNYSWGFVDYLLSFLDGYVPGQSKCISDFRPDSRMAWDLEAQSGLYWDDYNESVGFAWTKKACEVTVQDSGIREAGLEIQLDVPDFIFMADDTPCTVNVYVNGNILFSQDFLGEWSGSIVLDTTALEQTLKDARREGLYDVEIFSSKYFIPVELGINADGRELALRLKYVGRQR